LTETSRSGAAAGVAGRISRFHDHDKEPHQGRHLAGRGLGDPHDRDVPDGATLAAVIELSVCAGLITRYREHHQHDETPTDAEQAMLSKNG